MNNKKKKKVVTKKLDCIKEHFILSESPIIFMQREKIIFKDEKERKFDRAEISLLFNSSWNLKYCIYFAKYFLNLSSKKNVKKLTNKKPDYFENKDRYEDFILAIEHRFLLPSVLFYNASFDYLSIFIFNLLTKRKEIIESKETNKQKVLKEMEKLGLFNKKHSWIFALNSLITKKEKIINQMEKKLENFFGSDFNEIYSELKENNKKLRIEHYANIIKHQQIPFFKPASMNNIGGAKRFVDINQFYNIEKPPSSVTFGISEIVLDIEKTQEFLVQYHNLTIKTFNYVLNKIYMEKRKKY